MERTKYVHQNLEGQVGNFESESAAVWEACKGTQIDRWHEAITVREKSSMFGYADLTILCQLNTGVLFPIKLRGVQVKSIKGKPALGFAAEKAANGQFYEHYMTRSAAAREALTALVFGDEEILATIQKAGDIAPSESPAGSTPDPTPASLDAQSANNPFGAEAVEA